MAIVAAQISAVVKAEGIEETERKLESVGKKASETKGHFEGLKKIFDVAGGIAAFGAVTAGFGFVKDQIGSVIELTSEYQQTEAQMNQVLKSTHDVSGMTATALDDLAQKFSKTTMFSADQVQQGENLLLTFTNIGKKVFPDTTQAILDVSQAMGQDLQSSAIQVGKALDDPIKGVTALQRIGVTFSDKEKEQIKTMMAHNDIIGAQKVILHELSTEFGGSATAAGKTFGGQLAIIGHTFDDIKIKIGTALLPILGDLLNKYIVPLANQFSNWMLKGGGLNDFQTWLKTTTAWLENQFLPDLNKFLNTYVLPLITQVYNLFVNSGFLSGVWQTMTSVLQTLVPMAGGLLKAVAGFLQALQTGNPAAQTLAGILGTIAVLKIGQTIGEGAKSILDMSKNAASFLSNEGKQLLDFFSPTGGIAADATASSSIIEGDLTTVGTTADTTAGEVSMIGSAAVADAGEATAAGATIGGVFSGLLTVIADVFAGLSAVAGVLAAIGLTISTIPGTLNTPYFQQYFKEHGWGPSTNTGNIPQLNAGRRHASGGVIAPGTWGTVGEEGAEWVYGGTGGVGVLPHGINPPMASGGSGQIAMLQIDGYTLARVLLPYIASNIRTAVGIVGM